MEKDPIVDEVHKARERLLRECEGDLEKVLERLKRREEDHKDRVVTKDQLRELLANK